MHVPGPVAPLRHSPFVCLTGCMEHNGHAQQKKHVVEQLVLFCCMCIT